MHATDEPAMKRGDAGYTLTEMLVVIVIIALIASVLTPSLLGQLARARAKTAALQLDTTTASLELFKDDTGRYPTVAEGLKALTIDPGVDGWLGPYLKSDKSLNDPWGHPIIYVAAAEGVSVTMLGADGKTGGKGVDQDLTASLR